MVSAIQSLKVSVLGDEYSGKTSALISYTNNKFPQEYSPTIFDNYSVNVMCGSKVFNLTLWDTSGNESYDRLRPLSHPQTDIFLLFFSVVSRESFLHIQTKWEREAREFCPNTPILLVGTKIDLRSDRKSVHHVEGPPVFLEEGLEMSRKIGAVGYVECSSYTQKGLKVVFENAIKTIVGHNLEAKEKKEKRERRRRSMRVESCSIM
eukprot:TRINITY_DN2366_c0_g1_i1.p1 TRINITY_DN2366_c0_g1~~TRINITY_DN2366_c0_g1_i1.p1  ORF type:complete len:207 (+),score=42.89 TRINITY_DN2366_c0_g1_i1:381-1001(+)